MQIPQCQVYGPFCYVWYALTFPLPCASLCFHLHLHHIPYSRAFYTFNQPRATRIHTVCQRWNSISRPPSHTFRFLLRAYSPARTCIQACGHNSYWTRLRTCRKPMQKAATGGRKRTYLVQRGDTTVTCLRACDRIFMWTLLQPVGIPESLFHRIGISA